MVTGRTKHSALVATVVALSIFTAASANAALIRDEFEWVITADYGHSADAKFGLNAYPAANHTVTGYIEYDSAIWDGVKYSAVGDQSISYGSGDYAAAITIGSHTQTLFDTDFDSITFTDGVLNDVGFYAAFDYGFGNVWDIVSGDYIMQAQTNTFMLYVNSWTSADFIYTGGDINITQAHDNAVLPAPVPVPGAFWLFGSGLIGLLGLRRNKER